MAWDIELLHWPVIVQFIVFTGGFLVISVLGAAFFRWIAKDSQSPSGEVVAVTLGVYGAIYGVLLAFVIVTAWEELQVASAGVGDEAASMASIVRDAEFFPRNVRDDLRAEVKEYLHYTINVEWKDMQKGEPPHNSNPAIENLFTTVRDNPPADPKYAPAYERILTDLNSVISNRRDRIENSEENVPALLQLFIFGGAVCVILLACMYRTKNFLDQAVLLTSISILLASSLLMAVALNHPFIGDISVSPADFYRGILAQFW
ncbi:bestrophin-like domain [Streptomyces sp. 900105245]